MACPCWNGNLPVDSGGGSRGRAALLELHFSHDGLRVTEWLQKTQSHHWPQDQVPRIRNTPLMVNRTTHHATCLSDLCPYHSPLCPFHPRHTGLHSVSWIRQPHSHRRTFASAVPAVMGSSAPDLCTVASFLWDQVSSPQRSLLSFTLSNAAARFSTSPAKITLCSLLDRAYGFWNSLTWVFSCLDLTPRPGWSLHESMVPGPPAPDTRWVQETLDEWKRSHTKPYPSDVITAPSKQQKWK